MMDINHASLYGSTDGVLVENLGTFVRHHRLAQNKSQARLAKDAGINRTTLVEFEKGRNVSLLTFIQLLRVLGQLHVLDQFRVQQEVSPLLLAEMELKQRRRASRPRKKTKR
jgi:transcriptional regulator with XRE-family HTH domain